MKSNIKIPKNLDECIEILKKELPEQFINNLKIDKEKIVAYHMSLGMNLRNNWGLWAGSKLSKWFNKHGIQHPDDMSGIILDSLVLSLKGEPIEFEKQVKYYQDYWKKMNEISNVGNFTVLVNKEEKPKIL